MIILAHCRYSVIVLTVSLKRAGKFHRLSRQSNVWIIWYRSARYIVYHRIRRCLDKRLSAPVSSPPRRTTVPRIREVLVRGAANVTISVKVSRQYTPVALTICTPGRSWFPVLSVALASRRERSVRFFTALNLSSKPSIERGIVWVLDRNNPSLSFGGLPGSIVDTIRFSGTSDWGPG